MPGTAGNVWVCNPFVILNSIHYHHIKPLSFLSLLPHHLLLLFLFSLYPVILILITNCGFPFSFFLFLEYWTSHGVPAQNASSTSFGSLEYPSGISPPAPNLPTVQPSSTHPRRSFQRKSRHETIDTLRAELQAIRDGIARILTNLQTLNDTLPVHQPTAQDAQRHNVSSTRRRMDEMDTSPVDSVADDQNNTAMTGNAFDHAIQEDTTQSSGFGFPDEGRQQVHCCGCQPCVSTNHLSNSGAPASSFTQCSH